MAESDSSGTLTASYTYAEGGLVSMTRAGQTYYYQTSAHGDVVSLTDASGQVVNTYSYDPWGALLTVSETVQNPFRYASYYYDSDTELYHLRQPVRMESPSRAGAPSHTPRTAPASLVLYSAP